MNMIRWYNIPKQTKVNAYTQIAEKTGMANYAVEKDWWVVQTLSIIFEMEIAAHLVFKGGTSLSKAWGLIDRFSEDIDLAVDRSFFGFKGDLLKKQRTNLRKKTSAYISDTFYPALKSKFQEKGLSDVVFKLEEAKDSDQDPRIIEIYYPNVIESPGYIEPNVKVEIGCRSLREPFSIQTFSSLIDEHYSNAEFSLAPIEIPTVNPERTFLEKIFLLHEEFQR
ncbi:MAG: nucleotidyl transferase AbiEii/AbiGii toxin family protein [Mariniphaga sp.]|nr:nucleotidyl transferase AbiEii/AbiGii toxin family protein [Mariniphaga sp.]